MKRTLLSRRNALLTRSGARAGVVVLAVALLLVLIRLLVPGLVLGAETPFLRFSSSVTTEIARLSSGFADAAALTKERDVLVSENAALGNQNAALTAALADVQGALASTAPAAASVIAGVLARPPEVPYDTLILASGGDSGIKSGDRVFYQGIPIGTVAAVSGDAARVVLYSAPAVSIDAWVGAARTPITLLGAGGGAFLASAPRAASTSVSDLVYLGGPASLPIGKVAALGGEASSPSVTLSIQSSVNLFSIPTVVVEHATLAP